MADDNKSINPQNVTTGDPTEGGCGYVNFESSPKLPATASEDITGTDTKWENLGEFSENGYTKSVSTTDNTFRGWHGSVMLTKLSEETNTFKIEFIEVTRVTVLKLRYGKDNVKTDNDGNPQAITPTTIPSDKVAIVIDELLSNGMKMRTVFPSVTINSVDDEQHTRGSLMLYGITFTASVDADNHPYYIYYAKPGTTTKAGA